MKTVRGRICGLSILAIGALALPAAAKESSAEAGLASVYHSIADTIMAAKDSESAVVGAILAVERDLALAALDKAAGSSGTAADLRTAAARIGDYATEGGAAIEPIRNRLLQGGHHHHADDTGPAAVYDEGYVVLTKKLKQEALGLANRCAKAAESSSLDTKEIASIREALQSLSSRALAKK